MALHDVYNCAWQQWPENAKKRTDLKALHAQHAPAVERYRREQFLFWQQWDALHAYASVSGHPDRWRCADLRQ